MAGRARGSYLFQGHLSEIKVNRDWSSNLLDKIPQSSVLTVTPQEHPLNKPEGREILHGDLLSFNLTK